MQHAIATLLIVLVVSPIVIAQELSQAQIIETLRGRVEANMVPADVKRIETVAQFTLRVTGQPTCSFEGTLIQEGQRRELTMSELPAECAAYRDHLGTTFATATQLSGLFLGNYAYELMGERIADGDRQYHVRATTRNPQENLHEIKAWISWETGLIRDGELFIRQLATDPITIVQTFYQQEGRWLLKGVRARTVARVWAFVRTGIEADIDVKTHRHIY